MNQKLRAILISNYGGVIALGLFGPIYALFVVKIGGSALEAGISSAVYYVLGGFFMLLLRPLLDNVRARPTVYLLGNLTEAVAALLLITVSSVAMLYLVQIVHAIATALRVPAQRALYAQHEDKGHEGSEWSVMEGGNFIIIGLSGAVGGVLVTVLGFNTVFAVMAAIQVLSAGYCATLLTPHPSKN